MYHFHWSRKEKFKSISEVSEENSIVPYALYKCANYRLGK